LCHREKRDLTPNGGPHTGCGSIFALGRRMTRPLRVHVPGVACHVMSRGNNKDCIFTDDRDHEHFLELLEDALARFSVHCHVFCLLWNHYHLLVTPDEIPLWRMMQQLNSGYCQWFDRRHDRVGHVLQGRYKGPLVDNAGYFLNAARYIVLNPVEAKLVEHPIDWNWSSY